MVQLPDPAVPFHPSEPSPGLVAVALCVALILSAFAFLLRAS
ncbi:hypothetical protein OPKNFCMD_5486 [Methylobacterium crusticola]|uniref:Uncharacterized protein n=1 Tax=Methylobacterium crusticola TaxID=1697972 RepID=A0ABQ4R6E4_9HYPH|nr:hypothetical protein [Methylobacterium crusticola]GJD52719.1 hypothetical protein OPKNFCMD_5486 [Methylobacterium crusticola]